jgi:hypothetical protein
VAGREPRGECIVGAGDVGEALADHARRLLPAVGWEDPALEARVEQACDVVLDAYARDARELAVPGEHGLERLEPAIVDVRVVDHDGQQCRDRVCELVAELGMARIACFDERGLDPIEECLPRGEECGYAGVSQRSPLQLAVTERPRSEALDECVVTASRIERARTGEHAPWMAGNDHVTR